MNSDNTKMDDPRFKIANREALIGVGLVIFNFIWWFAFAYGMGSKPASEYTYVFGFPAWFFYSCILGFVIVAILVIVIVNVWFVEVDLEDEEGDDQ